VPRHREGAEASFWHTAAQGLGAALGRFRSEADINSGKSQNRIYEYTP